MVQWSFLVKPFNCQVFVSGAAVDVLNTGGSAALADKFGPLIESVLHLSFSIGQEIRALSIIEKSVEHQIVVRGSVSSFEKPEVHSAVWMADF